jgi:hypothetical protein
MPGRIVSGILFLYILQFITPQKIFASDNTRILITDHFIIKTEAENSNCSVAFAEKLEKYHSLIINFIEYEPLSKMNISVIGGRNFPSVFYDITGPGNQLVIDHEGNFYDSENILYNKLFNSYLRISMNNKEPASVMPGDFLNALMKYTDSGSKFTAVIVNDLVNNLDLLPLDVGIIEKYNSFVRESIYTAFIDYVVTVHGRKVLSQSVKDAYYYDNIFNSLSMITGSTVDEINKGFNLYLSAYRKDSVKKNVNKIFFDTGDDGFKDISFTVLNNNISVLQENKGDYRILYRNGAYAKTINLKHSEKNSRYNDIIYIGDNLIAVSEILGNGGTVFIYDMTKDRLIRRFELPYIFPTALSRYDQTHLLFSAFCGSKSDVFTLNSETGEVNNITESGNFFSPARLNNSLYCISITDKYSIIEISGDTGKKKIIFSTNQKLAGLGTIDGNRLVFSMEMNGLTEIYSIDVHGENLRQITGDMCMNHFPRFSGNSIYFFSYYKSRYRIFFTASEVNKY